MEDQNIAVVFNSASGTRERGDEVAQGVEKLRKKGLSVVEKPLPNDASKMPGFLEGLISGKYRALIGVGGDGSVNLLAGKLVDTGVPLFVVPAGTFNHFAKHIGMPESITEAFEVFDRSEVKYIDTGEVNGALFVNFSSVGVYTEIIRERTRREKLGKRKWPSFFFSLIKNMIRYPVLEFSVERNGGKVPVRSSFLFVGNNPFVFNIPNILEGRESFEEGVLHFLIAKDRGRLGLIRLFSHLLAFRFDRVEDFESLYLREFEIRSKEKYLNVTIDGEIAKMQTPLMYRTRPKSLAVLVPKEE